MQHAIHSTVNAINPPSTGPHHSHHHHPRTLSTSQSLHYPSAHHVSSLFSTISGAPSSSSISSSPSAHPHFYTHPTPGFPQNVSSAAAAAAVAAASSTVTSLNSNLTRLPSHLDSNPGGNGGGSGSPSTTTPLLHQSPSCSTTVPDPCKKRPGKLNPV
uniref:Uncharacterized protein n=2 Tax=Tetranychus urticae TaxID=32264 RepID=T1L0A6_TETUR